MINQLSIFLFGVGISSHALAGPYDCHLSEQTGYKMASNNNYKYGPNADAAVQNNSNVSTSIAIARDAWDATYAADRIGSWTGTVSLNDCPDYQPFQIGAFDFTTTSCVSRAMWAYQDSVAFVDWPSTGWTGSYSVSVNLYYTFVANGSPNTGEYDLRAILAHEFGHSLGLHHMMGGVCTNGGYKCSGSPNRDTMSYGNAGGPTESCQTTLSSDDVTVMNRYYP